MEGNDGRQYKSIKTKKGSHVWIPVSGSKGTRKNGKGKKGTIYNIHDNGNVSYMVEDRSKEKRAVVYETIGDDDTGTYTIGPQIHDIKYMNIWLGDNAVSKLYGDFEKGNTILLQTEKNKYVVICRQTIYSFSLDASEEISKFVAPIGNNDVPYPVLLGKEYVYFMLNEDHCYVPRDKFVIKMTQKKWADAYSYYYGFEDASGEDEKIIIPLKNYAKKMKKYKLLEKRKLL
jgi:hypothetical protein